LAKPHQAESESDFRTTKTLTNKDGGAHTMHLSAAKQTLHALANRLHGTLPDGRDRVESDLAEILLYLIRLANRFGIDLAAAADKRLQHDTEHQPTLVHDSDPPTLGELPPSADVHPLRILIVEDERMVAADLQQTLYDLGYNAYAIAASGAEAVAISRAAHPDIAVIEIHIPGLLDGIETAMLLRREFNTAVIFLTSHADDETLQRAKQVQPDGYLLKPVNAPSLKATIELTSHRHRHA